MMICTAAFPLLLSFPLQRQLVLVLQAPQASC